MGGINLNESGLDFVRQVFVTFGGNTTVLTLFLLSVLYLALKGKKEERYVFVTTAVFLAFTVYNPFAVKYILGKLGMVNVYYRFFWILPMVLTIGYACTKVVGGQKKGWRRYLTAAALAAVICFGGNSVLAGGLPKLPDNQYKMPDDLLAVCTVLEILKEKAAAGVDVRVIYDDFGCVTTLPYQYYKSLQQMVIKCAAFNQFRPVLNVILNNRDHRKIAVIDGHTAFTGGINLADEYINRKERFGHWKDSGICLHGEALPEFFDRVLVDAPCSGEGMFRKEPVALQQHCEALVKQCAELGAQILDCAAAALAPGGQLVYSTCTFAPEEDEGQVAAFLQRHPEFALADVLGNVDYTFGSPGEANRTGGLPLDVSKVRRIWPCQGGEGHFMARLVKAGTPRTLPPEGEYTPEEQLWLAAAAEAGKKGKGKAKPAKAADARSPCRTARYVAWRKSPPSVCLMCARPLTSVIFISVISDPVSTPGCFRSSRCVRIRRCQLRSRVSSLQTVPICSPLPGSAGSSSK